MEHTKIGITVIAHLVMSGAVSALVVLSWNVLDVNLMTQHHFIITLTRGKCATGALL